jgi:hypothetical protein
MWLLEVKQTSTPVCDRGQDQHLLIVLPPDSTYLSVRRTTVMAKKKRRVSGRNSPNKIVCAVGVCGSISDLFIRT